MAQYLQEPLKTAQNPWECIKMPLKFFWMSRTSQDVIEPFWTIYNSWQRLRMQQNAAEHLRQCLRTFSNLSDVLNSQENAWENSKTFHNTYNGWQPLRVQQQPRKPENNSQPLETFQNCSEQRECLGMPHNIKKHPRLSRHASKPSAIFETTQK